MYETITLENWLMYAIHNYDNPQCETEDEFYEDLKRFKYLKRLFRKYNDSGILKERLILNHIIILQNVFGSEAAGTLLLFKIEQEYWSALKTFMVFLNMVPERELKTIDMDPFVWKVLDNI